ncbi:2-polyprenyl-6-methoxyphenol hydroxylase-like FAD-dependent oxidoreductase [Paenibacillus pabuli]|uniref:Flavin-dependent monooxygenase n=2 Tax=Paenibacillus TaxID=44249 RepID=A0A855XT94_9BACL|nr:MULTISPECIES: FAD-dependent monooxygenase [Paenibacillus]PWW38866.1 2-polyprenyl-6-methoxyphenol hydroxylase-like FAD-dependent oxidoreductase [Paenibacillus pabuli]PXW06051.1 2-polyprenyl-6-methoxyphenol hydroxylase-like FAD-dependent oxidoreductase [Paenibacillus taichungensis]RAI89790.1 2-polyprenyl-6-methoxyphenol hydroxylase-like FAD-dependent oxidoreductase [Paenibacillus pabuli]
MPTKEQHIAIIGGGPGGLMLALLLQKNGINSTIYEREISDKNAQRGGSLDIHEDSGQLALREVGLLEQFQEMARYAGQDLRLYDKHSNIQINNVADDNVPGSRPEIDRGVLCGLLLNALATGCIRYGCKLVEAIPLVDGKHELHFEDGHTEIVDLVVGADGAFSHVRPLLTDAVAEYTGISRVDLSIDSVKYPELAAFNSRGSMFALGDNKSISGQLNGDGRIRVGLSFRAERDWLDTCRISFDQPEEAKEQLLTYFDDWSESLKNYIRCADGAIITRRIYTLPIGLRWDSKPGVTLIGDAAHLAPPAGDGVNLAMRDAMELALSIIDYKDELDKAIETYEDKMFAYSSGTARMSYDNFMLMLSDDAVTKVKSLLEKFLA